MPPIGRGVEVGVAQREDGVDDEPRQHDRDERDDREHHLLRAPTFAGPGQGEPDADERRGGGRDHQEQTSDGPAVVFDGRQALGHGRRPARTITRQMATRNDDGRGGPPADDRRAAMARRRANDHDHRGRRAGDQQPRADAVSSARISGRFGLAAERPEDCRRATIRTTARRSRRQARTRGRRSLRRNRR